MLTKGRTSTSTPQSSIPPKSCDRLFIRKPHLHPNTKISPLHSNEHQVARKRVCTTCLAAFNYGHQREVKHQNQGVSTHSWLNKYSKIILTPHPPILASLPISNNNRTHISERPFNQEVTVDYPLISIPNININILIHMVYRLRTATVLHRSI